MNPGDTGHVLLNRIPVPALNEGRGMNPGDTPTVTGSTSREKLAQRRPGHEPRRHPAYLGHLLDLHFRSTKAGA